VDKNFFLSVIIALTAGLACDPSDAIAPAPSPSCGTGVAHIEILDGSMIRACGCNETANTQFTAGQVLTCTVKAGTVLYFDFVAITVTHQVSIIGIGATPPFSSNTSESTQISAITTSTVGVFPFSDVFYPTIGGNIVVQ